MFTSKNVKMKNVFIICIILIICGCATTKYDLHETEKLGQLNSEKALVYIIRGKANMFTPMIASCPAYSDSIFLGMFRKKTYSYTYVEPGERLIWVKAQLGPIVIAYGVFEFEAGKEYFLYMPESEGLPSEEHLINIWPSDLPNIDSLAEYDKQRNLVTVKKQYAMDIINRSKYKLNATESQNKKYSKKVGNYLHNAFGPFISVRKLQIASNTESSALFELNRGSTSEAHTLFMNSQRIYLKSSELLLDESSRAKKKAIWLGVANVIGPILAVANASMQANIQAQSGGPGVGIAHFNANDVSTPKELAQYLETLSLKAENSAKRISDILECFDKAPELINDCIQYKRKARNN
ncbi:MAG: DUF2846 domain-containing protein [Candidatus Cloacimonetes bacterium]|nr:DUF2846 domain-containing protein [Candidatus Cloacimonadota bacterium]